MATRSAIIRKTLTGTYEGIYCHYDGYTSGVGQILLDHYADPAKVQQLVALGDLSILAEHVEPTGPHSFGSPQPNTTVAYHRDRNEPLRIATGDTVDEVAYAIGHDGFVYVFEEARWTVNGESLAKALGVKESEPAQLDPIALCAGIPTDVLAAEVARRIAAAANGLF